MSLQKNNSSLPRANHQIRVPSVRLIDIDGNQIGVYNSYEAIRLAQEQGMDLVEINPKSTPPVCKIMDFGKYKFELKKKEKALAAAQKVVITKQIVIRPATSEHDLKIKANQVQRLLEEGNNVKLSVVFKGREAVHQDLGEEAIKKVLGALKGDTFTVEEKNTESKQISYMLSASSKE